MSVDNFQLGRRFDVLYLWKSWGEKLTDIQGGLLLLVGFHVDRLTLQNHTCVLTARKRFSWYSPGKEIANER
jgi:hypothetical protein